LYDLIVWDFDGVLNRNFVDGRFVWLDGIEHDLGIHKTRFQDAVFGSGMIQDVMRGALDLRDVVADWLASERHSLSPDAFLDYWFTHDARADTQVLGWLAGTPTRHVIGTNNEARRAAYIETQMGFSDMVEHIFASGRMGLAKPDPKFFAKIEAWSGVAPCRILMIDDTLANIEACQRLGWSGFHFTEHTRHALPTYLGLK
jgi:putative hydrolase of the HAD superfamily